MQQRILTVIDDGGVTYLRECVMLGYATHISKCETRVMQAVVRMSAVNAMSKLLPSVRAELSGFTAPSQDVLRPARGIIYALKLALVFWALVAAALLKWAML